MFKIKPFKGYIYNTDKIKDLSLVTSPPYDVISSEQQDILYQKNPNNIVRLILNKEESKYEKAAEYFKQWQEEKVIVPDEEESIYVYEQEFLVTGTEGACHLRRKGFIALAKLEDFSTGKVKPHEKTLSAPKEDRLNLMRSCGANFSSIFSLYEDQSREIGKIIEEEGKQKPLFEFVSAEKTKEKLWRLTDKNKIKEISNLMEAKTVFIADGHHRYETALNYRNEKRKEIKDQDKEYPFDYVMMTFVAMEDEGLVIFPTHRLVFGLNLSNGKVLDGLGKNFQIEKIDETDENDKKTKLLKSMKEKAGHVIGMLFKNDYYILALKDDPKKIIDNGVPEVLKSLDVIILHKLIIEDVLGLSEESVLKQTNLKYVKSDDKAFDSIKSGKFEIAFLLNPTKIEELEAVAKEGQRMPQKSTFFYPKLTTGLVINKLSTKK